MGGAPRQWPKCGRGAGQLEYQDYDSWTSEEKQLFAEGRLKAKWGVGQVSVRLPLNSCLSFISICYGYLPFIVPGYWIIWALVTFVQHGSPRFFPYAGSCIAVSFAIVNELVTKNICKLLFPKRLTDRPPEAVCKHPGLPSGHVMNAYTLMTWLFLEATFHKVIYPEWLVGILLIFLPVPWARVYNRDHTVVQVAVSIVTALIMGTIAYLVRRRYFPGHQEPWDWYHGDIGFVEHDPLFN